jgi:hypothetical protein
VTSPDALQQEWPWLTSGHARLAWNLGEALSVADSAGELANRLPSYSRGGSDFRIICGYVAYRRRTLGDQWYEAWLAELDPQRLVLMVEVAWRCGATTSVARKLARALRTSRIDSAFVEQMGYGNWADALSPDILTDILEAMIEAEHESAALIIIERRLDARPEEMEAWRALALRLITSSRLIRSSNMTNYHWKELAGRFVGIHAEQIATAIFREQATRRGDSWFSEHSEAAGILQSCVSHAPAQVWKAMQPYLHDPKKAYVFAIGLPRGLLEQFPVGEVLSWVAVDPEERASLIAKLASKNYSNDETLSARIVGMYGDNDDVAGAFLSEYTSGSWIGRTSEHWDALADALEPAANRSNLPKLRQWATRAQTSLRSRAGRDREREAEEDLKYR